MLLQIFWSATIHINTPLWSLSAEWFVNLFAATFRPKNAIAPYLVAGFLIEGFGFYLDQKYQLNWGVISYLIAIGRVTVGFYLGIALRRNLKSRIYNGSITKMCISLFLFFVVFFLYMVSTIFVMLAAPICYLIIREVASFDETSLPRQFVSFCSYIGRISYGVYVWHAVIGWLAISKFILKHTPFEIHGQARIFIDIFFTVTIVVLVTELSIKYFEKPLRIIAQRKLKILNTDE